MGITAALNGAKHTGPTLKIDVILAGLTPADADALRKALTDPAVPTNQITVALNAEGIAVTSNTVAVWRRRNDLRAAA